MPIRDTVYIFFCVLGFVLGMSNSVLTSFIAACIASVGILVTNRLGIKHPQAIHKARIVVLLALVLLAILAVVKHLQ